MPRNRPQNSRTKTSENNRLKNLRPKTSDSRPKTSDSRPKNLRPKTSDNSEKPQTELPKNLRQQDENLRQGEKLRAEVCPNEALSPHIYTKRDLKTTRADLTYFDWADFTYNNKITYIKYKYNEPT
jgi:hypothetical protein